MIARALDRPRRRGLAAIAAALLMTAATCEQCEPISDPRRGNIDRVTDAVLATGSDGHAYLVTANPELEHLRVLDLTTERFVDAPNRYFPTSVAVGPATRRIAIAAGDSARVFALDGALDEVHVVRTVEASGTPFSAVGDPVPVGRGAADIAAFADALGSELWITLPEDPAGPTLQVIAIAKATGVGAEVARVALPAGAHPDRIEVDPTGAQLVVTDAVLSTVHVIDRATRSLDRSLDVGGPTAALAIGVVDVGDGLAPVALVGRADEEEVAAIRLFRPDFREDAAALLGRAGVPSLPLALYVPDHRASATVCCRGLSDAAVDAREVTDAWGAVAMATGSVLYVQLAAPTEDPARRLVRLVDDDPTGLGAPSGVNLDTDVALWVPATGGEDRRPTGVTLTAIDNFGTPPFVGLVDAGETLLLTWEGSAPGLAAVGGAYLEGTFTANVDIGARGARVGDVAVITVDQLPGDCADRTLEASILTVSGATATLDRGADGLDADDELCITRGSGAVMAVLANEAFVVLRADGTSPGRLNLVTGDPENTVALPGGALTMTASANGLPLRGSELAVPLDPHVDALGLALSAARQSVGTGGGFGTAGFLPTAIVGGLMTIPDNETTGATIEARRMVVTTASPDSLTRLFELFACDEAETTARLCTTFR